MDALILVGSARKSGSTSILCSKAADSLTAAGVNVKVMYPYDMEIGHCTNCSTCEDLGRCVIDDDMTTIYKAMNGASIVIFGTPVHFSGISSILKQVMDRFQCAWHVPLKTKRVVGVIANGGTVDPYFNNIISELRSLSNTLNGKWGGCVTVRETDAGGLNELNLKDAHHFGITLYELAKELPRHPRTLSHVSPMVRTRTE